MPDNLVLQNLLSPPILFFFLGAAAVFVGSDLEIPQPIPRLFSLYLLFAIGFHGGTALSKSGIGAGVVVTLGAAVLLAVLVPLYSYAALRLRFDVPDAAAIAATYGSISAVTFITAGSFLQTLGIPSGGHMVAAMALMESPAVIVGVMLARSAGATTGAVNRADLVKDAFVNGSVFLILGSLLIGLVTGEAGDKALHAFTTEIFTGVLALFLLDMGIVAARRLRALGSRAVTAAAYAIGLPVVNAVVGITAAAILGLTQGDAVLFTVLCASASYIAVPAAMRVAVPEANPSLYVSMALGVTFPLNIIVGLPVYVAVIGWLWRA